MQTLKISRDRGASSSTGERQHSINVLYVIGSLQVGGAENQVVTLASALNSDRYKLHVCCLRHEGIQADMLRARGIPVFSLGMRLRYWPIAVYRLYRLVRQIRPQIVHTHLAEADMWGRLVGRLAGVPVIVSTVHGRFYWRRRGLWRLLDRVLNHFTDKLIAVSEDIRESFIERQGVAKDKVIAIANAVDLERFSRRDCREAMRAELGVEADSPLVGTVGRLAPEKRLDHLLQAARMVQDAIPRVRFLIIGDGPSREELNGQAVQLDLAPQIVRFLGSRQDIPELLQALDIFVLSSETEGLPVSLLEAMATAKPVIATRVGGIPQVIVDGQDGLLVPAHEPASLAKAILTLIENNALRESLAREARRTVDARFSTREVGRQIVALYNGLLDAKLSTAFGDPFAVP